jgi:hypothetical protein
MQATGELKLIKRGIFGACSLLTASAQKIRLA